MPLGYKQFKGYLMLNLLNPYSFIRYILLVILFVSSLPGNGEDFSGFLGFEYRFFTETALQDQDSQGYSLVLEPEWISEGEYSRWQAKLFARWDSMDDERSHADIRELYWEYAKDNWVFAAGIDKVFWGVAETQHLVDVINQTDFVENFDQEDKLGQPMLRWLNEQEWGTVEVFALLGFRERRFPGEEGRLKLLLPVDEDSVTYESSDEDNHIDWALRWSHVIGSSDIGVSYFQGTRREPFFNGLTDNLGNIVALAPFYPQMKQWGLDWQVTLERWLWKLEVISQETDIDTYTAAVAGFEYTFFGIFDTAIDVGWILEYQFDERDRIPFGDESLVLNDLINFGARLAWNDVQSTELLLGYGTDKDDSIEFWSVEGARRIGDNMTLSLEARIFSSINENDPFSTLFFAFRNDDHLQMTFEYYF